MHKKLKELQHEGIKQKTYKTPGRGEFNKKVSFALVVRSEGSLCCKDTCKDNNKWRKPLQKIELRVLRLKEVATKKLKPCLDLIDATQC